MSPTILRIPYTIYSVTYLPFFSNFPSTAPTNRKMCIYAKVEKQSLVSKYAIIAKYEKYAKNMITLSTRATMASLGVHCFEIMFVENRNLRQLMDVLNL